MSFALSSIYRHFFNSSWVHVKKTNSVCIFHFKLVTKKGAAFHRSRVTANDRVLVLKMSTRRKVHFCFLIAYNMLQVWYVYSVIIQWLWLLLLAIFKYFWVYEKCNICHFAFPLYWEYFLSVFKMKNNKSVIWHRWFLIQLLMLVIWWRRMLNTIDLTVEYLLNLFRLVTQYLSWFIVLVNVLVTIS